MLTITPVRSKAEYRRFINLPFSLYPQGSHWVPPLKSGEMAVFHPSRNPSFAFSEATLWLAVQDGRDVGRIAAIINRRSQAKWGDTLGRFGYVNFVDDPAVSRILFITAEAWLAEHGCSGVLGPMGFTDIDEQGLLVEGFDEPGSLPVIYCHPYYRTHIEALGYVKKIDWLEHRLTVPTAVPGKVLRAAEFVREGMPEIRVLNAKKSREFKPYIDKVFALLNIAYRELFGTTEFTPEQVRYYTKMYFSLLHPAFTKLALDPEDRVVGLIIAMPSLTKAFQKMRGRLFPTGFLHLLRAMRKNDAVDIYLAAVHPEYDNSGLIAILIADFIQSLIDHGIKYVETSANLETNDRVLSFWKEFEHRQHKRRRVYEKKFGE